MRHGLLAPACFAAILISATAAALAQPEISWRHYRPTNTGILGDYVQAIALDEQDRPWIAAYTPFWEEGGMSRMNGDGTWEVLSSFDHPEITSPRFSDIVRDSAGIYWIGSNGGLLRYDPAAADPAAQLVRYDRFNTPMPGHQVVDVALAPDGSIWLAVYNVSSAPQGGLVRFTPATNQWQVWTTANGLTWGGGWPGWDAVGRVAVVPDANGQGGYTVWFSSPHNLGMGTWRNGAFTWLGNPQSPPPGRYPMRLPSGNAVDAQGNLWLITNQGLMRRTLAGVETLVGYPAGLSSEVSLVVALSGGRAALGTYYADVFLWDNGWSHLGNWGSGNHTYTLIEDSTGALWAGGIGGASRREGGAWQRYRLTNTGMVGFWTRTIDFAPDGRVFLNGNAGPGVGGFNIFDGQRWTGVNNHNYGLGPPWGLPSDEVAALCVRRSGHVAIAPAGIQGMLDWDGASYQYLVPQGFDILGVVEDSQSRLWATRYGNAGVFLVVGTNRTAYSSQNSALPGGSIGSIRVDPSGSGYVWITTQFGIARTNGITWHIYPRELLGLTQNTTAHMLSSAAPAADGTLWVGSMSGVFHFSPLTGQYTRYHPGNSAMPSDDVHDVHVAPDGSVWVSTFDAVYPYPGGLTHFHAGGSTHYAAATSPLPHNQIWALNSRVIDGGYELWVGTASEAVAVITVTTGTPPCPVDWNSDDSVNSADISAFITSWLDSVHNGSLAADFSADGVVNSSDISAFITAWLDAVTNGC